MPPALSHRERTLFVVEQKGKMHRLKGLISEAGFVDFEIQSTQGVLFDLPEDAIAISPISLMVTGYAVPRKDAIRRLKELIAEAIQVVVITEPDREGEFIAVQVATLCGKKPLVRLRLQELTVRALNEALAAPGGLDVGAATASAARRIVDRIVGYGFSTKSIPHAVGIVGRVLTAALSAFDRSPVVCGEWTGRLGEFEARGIIINRLRTEAERIETLLHHAGHDILRLPRERVRPVIAPPRPCNSADAILEGRRRLGIPTIDGQALLKGLYQSGKLSYARSDSFHLGPEVRKLALKMARSSRLEIAKEVDSLYQRPDFGARRHAHQALHPTYELDLELDPWVQDHDNGMIMLIGRRLVMSLCAPYEVERERIVPAALRQFISEQLGEAAAHVQFQLQRDVNAPASWRRWLKRSDDQDLPSISYYGADATALSFLAGSNFGRPSSQISFVDTLLRRRFINQYGSLTDLGKVALEYARDHAPFLLDHSRIEKVELLLDHNDSSTVNELVMQLCGAIGLPVELAQASVTDWYTSNNHRLPVPASSIQRRAVSTALRASN
jgi:DNA topoisomerase IA